MDYQDFEIFGENTRALSAIKRGKNHRFTAIQNNNTLLFIHQHDYESATKAYIRCIDEENFDRLIAEEIDEPRNVNGYPEYRLYGYPWIATEKPLIEGLRVFVVSHRDRSEKVNQMFNKDP